MCFRSYKTLNFSKHPTYKNAIFKHFYNVIIEQHEATRVSHITHQHFNYSDHTYFIGKFNNIARAKVTHYISNDPGNESRSFQGVTRAHQFDHWLVGTCEQPTIRLLFVCLFVCFWWVGDGFKCESRLTASKTKREEGAPDRRLECEQRCEHQRAPKKIRLS